MYHVHIKTLVCIVGGLAIEVMLISGYGFVGALLTAVSLVLWISFVSLLWFAFTPYYGD